LYHIVTLAIGRDSVNGNFTIYDLNNWWLAPEAIDAPYFTSNKMLQQVRAASTLAS
jgi:hypothetical protein